MNITTRRSDTELGTVLHIYSGPTIIWSDLLDEIHADVYDLFLALEYACGRGE